MRHSGSVSKVTSSVEQSKSQLAYVTVLDVGHHRYLQLYVVVLYVGHHRYLQLYVVVLYVGLHRYLQLYVIVLYVGLHRYLQLYVVVLYVGHHRYLQLYVIVLYVGHNRYLPLSVPYPGENTHREDIPNMVHHNHLNMERFHRQGLVRASGLKSTTSTHVV